MTDGYIWIVDDDDSIRWVLERTLTNAGFTCRVFKSALELIEVLATEKPDVLISDIRMPNMDGLTLLDHIKSTQPDLPVIIMTAHSDLDTAVNAYQKGAFDYLPKPFDIDEAVVLVQRAMMKVRDQNKTQDIQQSAKQHSGIIGDSPAMQEIYRIIGRLSRSSINILINGESGTGKELIAHALHQHSPRAKAPFIALNMAAIPKDLIESELFGHEKGAFTGATQVRHGRFEQADHGTLFLDEIGDMPLDIQTRLLRVLADGQFYRIGGYSPIKVDVRIIAATHQNLAQLVKESRFREDLYHRLNVIRIVLPPLRNRTEDIPQLAVYFLENIAKELDVEGKRLHPDTLAFLAKLPWSGNIRQLENLCRWLTIMSVSQEILVQDLPSDLLATQQEIDSRHTPTPVAQDWREALSHWVNEALHHHEPNLLANTIAQAERVLINCALSHTNGHKQDAAKLLGCGRNTLSRKLTELNITETH